MAAKQRQSDDMEDVSYNETARRILNLIFILNSATVPLTTEQIITDSDLGYGSEVRDSDMKKFKRDREKLDELGIHVIEIKKAGSSEAEQSSWAIDRNRSHIDSALITQDDADTLARAVDEYLQRGDIPYRSSLRRIRTLARSLSGTGCADEQDPSSKNEAGLAANSAIWAAYDARLAIKFSYIDGKGRTSTRTVKIYGIFTQQESCYFVGEDALTGSIRTFKADRVQKAWKPKQKDRYTIPAGFDTRDYLFLPLDLGGSDDVEVRFTFPRQSVESEIAAITCGRGALEQLEDGSWEWSVHASNLRSAVSMAFSHADCGMRPCAPAEVVDLWNSIVDEGVRDHA